VGYVGAGSQAHFYAVEPGELDRVEGPRDSTDSTVAVEIRGDSLGSLFNRWLIFYDDRREPITHDLLGRLCVLGLEDNRVLVKQVKRSAAAGRYDLFSVREPPLRDVAVAWAAAVRSMAP